MDIISKKWLSKNFIFRKSLFVNHIFAFQFSNLDWRAFARFNFKLNKNVTKSDLKG